MRLLEPSIEDYWKSVPLEPEDQQDEVEKSKQRLVDVHMMLAGFAIENLCKGYLAVRLSHQEQNGVKGGMLAKSLQNHRFVQLVDRTGMIVSENERNLVQRLGDAVWRGRYPCGTSHKTVRPFVRMQTDVPKIEKFLQKLRRHVGVKESSRAT